MHPLASVTRLRMSQHHAGHMSKVADHLRPQSFWDWVLKLEKVN